MNSKLESINFKLHLSHTSGRKKPEVKVLLDNELVFHQQLDKESNQVEVVEFERLLKENSGNDSHRLDIVLCNKEATDTVLDSNGNIIEDMLLTINNIYIDDIELKTLLWTESKYYPQYPKNYLDEQQKAIKMITGCVDLGWNGTWSLEFTSPFYLWLLDRI